MCATMATRRKSSATGCCNGQNQFFIHHKRQTKYQNLIQACLNTRHIVLWACFAAMHRLKSQISPEWHLTIMQSDILGNRTANCCAGPLWCNNALDWRQTAAAQKAIANLQHLINNDRLVTMRQTVRFCLWCHLILSWFVASIRGVRA